MTGAVPKKRLTRTGGGDRKSTRLNSSHQIISYAVFCLKKKKTHLNYSHQILTHVVFFFDKKTELLEHEKKETSGSMVVVRMRQTTTSLERKASSYTIRT